MVSSKRLRILIVTPSLPYPLIWGFGIRVYQIITYLAQRHDVSVIAYAGPDDQPNVDALRKTGAKIYPVFRPQESIASKRSGQLKSLVSPSSFQWQSLKSHPMQEMIDRVVAENRFDVIQVESSQMAGFHYDSRPVFVVDEHNVEYELLYRTFKTERAPVRKLFNWVEYWKFRREEQRSWHRADGCVLTSDREHEILRHFACETPSLVIPNGVDVDYFQPCSDVTPDPNNVVFVGVMHYRPNFDGALYFVREVLPRLLQQRPNLKFTIIGAKPPDELRAQTGPNVEITDRVPDTRPYLSRAGACVVPLRMGSGTRLKVLEGMAMGRPIVSTSLGCEGIDATPGEHLLVANDPDQFAASLLRVLEDKALAANLSRNGRALVEQRYSWSSVLGRLEAFLIDKCVAGEKSLGLRTGQMPEVAVA